MRDDATTTPAIPPSGRGIAYLCVLALAVLLGFGVPSAGAVGSAPEAENFIPQFGEEGSGTGQLSLPSGIAVAPGTGDVYVSEEGNNRVSEFSPWGHFIRAFGWGVADGISQELQVCTTICFMGLAGAGAGEFALPDGVAIDSSGDVYVREFEASADERVQKFDASGQFLLMFGGEVDKTQVHKREEQEVKAEPVTVTAEQEDVCTAVSGDVCGAGVAGSAHGWLAGGKGVALLPDGTVAVADRERIEEFEPNGDYKSEVKLPGKTVKNLAGDPISGDFYVTFTGTEENLYKLGPTGVSLAPFLLPDVGSLATDPSGNVYAASNDSGEIAEFDPNGKKLFEFDDPVERPGKASIFGLATNTIGDLYVANGPAGNAAPFDFISAYGPGPVVFEPPPKVPPTIASEYTVSADENSAVVRAQINPHFWSDTTYYVQYGTADCEASVCISQPAAPGSVLTGNVVAAPVTTGGVFLSNLRPDTTYHYRFVSVGSGGGPVFGPDRTFSTFSEQVANVNCSNESFRTGFSALLGDCRAYEMVSPVEKENGDILTLASLDSHETSLDQSSTSGGKLTYSSYRAFGEAKAAPYTSQYIATRDPVSGWSSEPISPVQRPFGAGGNASFENQYKFFSGDLSNAWLSVPDEPVLAPGAVEDFRTIYRRDDVSGGFEALTTVEPPTLKPGNLALELQGVSADGGHMVFRANDRLTANASNEKGFGGELISQLYESYNGGSLRLVSVLPNGSASKQYSSAGSYNDGYVGVAEDQLSSVNRAVSGDGTRVYWSEADSNGLGKIYLRENADREQSVVSGGECVEIDMACTVQVSSKTAEFWDATPDGSRALYTTEEGRPGTGELEEFDLEEDASSPIAGKTLGLLGASEDLSYIYFVSTEALAPGATAGAGNLYLRHKEATSFITTLPTADTTSTGVSALSIEPVYHVARVTPDGRHIVFVSSGSLTDYDNTDATTGQPDSEVYTYDADSGKLNCVSCDRSSARPEGREVGN